MHSTNTHLNIFFPFLAFSEKEAQYELILLSCIQKHPNLMEFTGVCPDLEIEGTKTSVLVVREYKGGSLKNFVRDKEGTCDIFSKQT